MRQDPDVKENSNQHLDEKEPMVTASLEFLRGSESSERMKICQAWSLIEEGASQGRKARRKTVP